MIQVVVASFAFDQVFLNCDLRRVFVQEFRRALIVIVQSLRSYIRLDIGGTSCLGHVSFVI